MSVVLSDEEFTLIYQSLHLSRHPGGAIVETIHINDRALDLADAVPETDRLRELALEGIPDLIQRVNRQMQERTRTSAPSEE